MTDRDWDINLLASRAAANRVSRRMFLRGSVVAAVSGGFIMSACSSNSGSSAPSSQAAGSGSPDLGSELNWYNWAEYDSTNVLKRFQQQLGPTITVDTYNSNEEMIAKLIAAGGTSGYDMVVPTGPYIPQMVSKDLLMELDLSKIPNFANLETQFTNQAWDPGNKYSVCKDSGSVGWLRDTTKVKTDVRTWGDFMRAAQTEASGQTSVLDVPTDLCGIYFWANGIDFTTIDSAQLDACEQSIVSGLAPHVKAFDTAPDAQGTYALSQAFSGTARVALLTAQNPDVVWHLGAPATELWMDNWTILKSAQHADAAYAWINFILEPANSLEDMLYHGTDPGVKGVQSAAIAQGMKFPENVFFTPSQLETMQVGAINEAQQRLNDIWQKAKAAAGGA